MSWRPWLVFSLFVVAVLINGVLLVGEEFPKAVRGPELTKKEEPLRHIQYAATSRRANFKQMGMDDDLANAVATRIDRLARLEKRFKELLSEQAMEVGDAFCSTTGLPQPYAATRFLVVEENEKRAVISTERLLRFMDHPWYRSAPVQAVYNELELTDGRRGDATLMGVSAVLLGREADVLDGHQPFGRGVTGMWGFTRLKRQNPSVQMMVIEYFSLMHYLTELANSRTGICS